VALGTSVFPYGWAAFHAPVINSAMTGRVKIERVLTEGTWSQTTGLYSGGTTSVLYLGRAEFDRIARPTRREFVSDSADNQMMQFMIPIDPDLNEATPAPTNLRWQSNDLVTILTNRASPMMEGEKMFLRGWAGDTEDWAYTLSCGFNAKQDS
jgi:hypothetical protein